MRIAITLLFYAYLIISVKADTVGYPMQTLLFGSTLIAEAKIVSHTNHNYQIKILDIYNNQKSSCIEGDLITFKKELNVIISDDIVHREDIENRLRGIAFLKKTTNGWRLLQFPFFKNGEATISFYQEYCRITGKPEEIKTQIGEYFKEFKLMNGKLILSKTEKQVFRAREELCQLVLTQYRQCYRFMKWEKFKNKLDCGPIKVTNNM